MHVFKIEYEFRDLQQRWSTNILGNDFNEVLGFMRKVIGRDFNVLSTESVCKVDGITDQIMDKVYAAHINNAKTVKEVKFDVEKKVKVDEPVEEKKERKKPGPKKGAKSFIKAAE